MNFILSFILLISILYTFCLVIISGIQCRDDYNGEVDWFAAYKIPKIRHHENKLIEDGTGYVFVTARNYTQWLFSAHSINDSDSILGNSLSSFYSKETEHIFHVFYNDQPPNEPSKGSKGHNKGVILADLEGGLWLIHSVPHFPPLSLKYQFSQSGVIKGQSFLCISLDLKNLNKVGTQLQYNEPQVFDSNIPEILQTKLEEIVKVVSGDVITQPPWYNKIDIASKNGVKFNSFAKTKKFGKDLYVDWIAPALQTDLFVETWLNGAGRLPSNCSTPFEVFNIENVSIALANVSFRDSQDHSKWAISLNSSWICIGDINRMEHQKFRGGGSVCLNDETLAQRYRDSVASIEKCPNLL